MTKNNAREVEVVEQKGPQYGKKGRKPRLRDERPVKNYDDIQSNNIEYWNKASNYGTAVKFPWDDIMGFPRSTGDVVPTTTLYTNVNGEMTFSGIMTVHFTPGPGWATGTADGVNRGLAMLMAAIRARLSTSNIGFETADLGIFFAATASIGMMIGYAKRILECRKEWRGNNYYYPRALILAQGLEYADITNNVNEYVGRLNALIDRYNGMSLLEGFDVYGRQYSMAHNVFVDEDSSRGQLYMFVPNGYYRYNDTAVPSKAEYVEFANTSTATFKALLDAIDDALNSWYGSSDLYQINGCLLRAFKDAPRQRIQPLTLEDTISPVQDRNFLLQIMNATILGPITSCDITQNPEHQNYVIWEPKVSDVTKSVSTAKTQYLRIFEDDVSEEDNMEMTRLLNFADESGNLKHCGSELVTKISMWRYNSMTNVISATELDGNLVEFSTDATLNKRALAKVGAISPFRYIPGVIILFGDPTAHSRTWHGMLGDQYNWMLYQHGDWENLQMVAYQSLWMPNFSLD